MHSLESHFVPAPCTISLLRKHGVHFFPTKVHLTKMIMTRHWVCLAVPVKKRSKRRTLRRSTILIVIRVTRHLQRDSQKLEKLTRSILSHVIDVALICSGCALSVYFSAVDLLGMCLFRRGSAMGTPLPPPPPHTHTNIIIMICALNVFL